MFLGMTERTTKELTALAPSTIKTKVVTLPQRENSSTNAVYNESAPHAIHRKYF
jgi:hypothetical protein